MEDSAFKGRRKLAYPEGTKSWVLEVKWWHRWPHSPQIPGTDFFISLYNCHSSLLADTVRTFVFKSRFTPMQDILTIARCSMSSEPQPEGLSLPWQPPEPNLRAHCSVFSDSHEEVILCMLKTERVAWIWKEAVRQKGGAEELSSQEINVFWSTQLTWEYNILVRQQQNVPLQNSAWPGISSRVKIAPWHILALTCFFCET